MSVSGGSARAGGTRREVGMALVAVMWMVAALSLLVSSLIFATRSEVHLVQQLRDATDAAALGDAAIQLAASELDRDPARPGHWHRRAYRFAGREVRVTVVPSAGLVNLNKASPALLADLFVYAGGVPPEQARRLAQRVHARRDRKPPAAPSDPVERHDALRAASRQGRFDVIEDLLQVEGFGFDLFDRIADLITVQSPGDRIYPPAAPAALIEVLAAGDAGVAATFLQRRDADDPTKDMTDLKHATPAAPGDRLYRLDAEVLSSSAVLYRRSVWVDLSGPRDRLPFRLLEVQPVRAVGVGVRPG
jgi:general secretion pathway protein K